MADASVDGAVTEAAPSADRTTSGSGGMDEGGDQQIPLDAVGPDAWGGDAGNEAPDGAAFDEPDALGPDSDRFDATNGYHDSAAIPDASVFWQPAYREAGHLEGGPTSVSPHTFGTPALPVQLTDVNGGCLGLARGDTTNGPKKLSIWQCSTDGMNQTWYMDPGGSIHCGWNPLKCVSIPLNPSMNPPQLELVDCDNGATQNQQWTYEGDGTIRNNGKCVELFQGSSNDGNAVELYFCNGTSGQRWQRFLGVPARPVEIVNGSGECLDLPNGDTTNGNKLRTETCRSDGAGQTWYMDGTDSIRYGADQTKCMDLPLGLAINANPIQIWDCDNGASGNQRWWYEGDMTIAKGGKCVESLNADSGDGNAVQINDCTGVPVQLWIPKSLW